MLTKELKDLQKSGYNVEELTPYQFRIDMVLDLYPKRRRFHNIRTQERGYYPYPSALKQFIAKQLASVPKDPEQPKAGRYLTPAMAAKAGWWTKIGKPKVQSMEE